MKMNYLSDDNKKSILGKRLSSRYLSSDAFTSSAGKITGRSISKLGHMFGRTGKTKSKNFYGAGQRAGLFEFKNIFINIILFITCFIVIGYTLPYTRYYFHKSLVKHTFDFSSDHDLNLIQREQIDNLKVNEYYVSPMFGKTDRFVVNMKNQELDLSSESLSVYAPLDYSSKPILLGRLDVSSTTKKQITLLSDFGQKNVLFINNAKTVNVTADVDSEESQEDKTEVVLDSENLDTKDDVFVSAVFEGFGYGQMRAQIPPQQNIDVDTILYARTEKGFIPAARVSYTEKDDVSTFTNIYAQLLVAPFNIYKVYIENIEK